MPTAKTTLLFVDDEPNILAGLRRMLRSQRGEWDMAFCDSGASALDSLASRPADVVISDMRMPGMDGAELLTHVRDRYPETVRIVLSGHSDQELTLRAVGPAHQYLSKPCDPAQLKAAITSATHLHRRVQSDAVRRLVASIESLPTLPQVYVDLVEEMHRPEACVRTAGEIVARDLGMSAKILQLVNSSFFGLPVRVNDVPHAVALLGLGVIRPLALSTGIFRQYEGRDLGGLSLGKLMAHSMRAATRAREIAQELSLLSAEEQSDVYLAGLLHDLGRLVLAQAAPGDYAEITHEASGDTRRLAALEAQRFDATHAEAGAHLLQLWGLPAALVDAVASHHRPSLSSGEGSPVVSAIHAAEVLTDHEAEWDDEYLARHDLVERAATWSATEPCGAVTLNERFS